MPDAGLDTALGLGAEALDRLMPMHVHLSHDGRIRGAGPTIAGLVPGGGLAGRRFFDVFALRRPRPTADMADLVRLVGQPLHLNLRTPPGTGFRGIAVPLALPFGAVPGPDAATHAGTGHGVATGAGRGRTGKAGSGRARAGAADPGRAGPAGSEAAEPVAAGLLINLSFGLSVAAAVRDHGLSNDAFAPTDLAVEMLYLIEAKTAVMQELHALNTRLQQAKGRAEELAQSDALTGLRNRRALGRGIDAAMARGEPFALMQIDLDHFKRVNDTRGHAAGDHVLCTVADILNRETRPGDLVARVGGDEFVVLFPGLVDAARLKDLGQRVIAAIERPIPFEGAPCRISASIGVTLSRRGGRGADAGPDAGRLLNEVDEALYASKNAGRGRVTLFAPPG